MKEILQYLTTHGEGVDSEIATATGIPLSDVRLHLSELVNQRAIMACRSIRFENNKETEKIVCRLIGYVRPATPGKRPKLQMKL